MNDTIVLDDAKRRQMELRSARDQLVDLLGFGLTLPLQDPDVRDERLTVPVHDIATISIDPGQTDVQYHLRDPDGVIVGTSTGGTGAATELVTPAITEDITFDVVATKKLDSERTAVLHESASVKVGLDLSLATRIAADPLDASLDAPADDHPRIVDWGSRVEVGIDDAQEGVHYHLVDLTDVELVDAQGNELTDPSGLELATISELEVVGLGIGQTTDLYIPAVQEDILVGIVATKTFDPATGVETMVGLLDLKLPLKVRADAALVAALMPIVDYDGDAAIAIDGSQASAFYQLYARPLDDRDFVYGATTADVLGVAVPGEEDARIPAPDWWTLHWPAAMSPAAVSPAAVAREGFTAVGAPQSGTGGDVQVVFPAVDEDHLVIVQARKEHAVDLGDAAAGTIASRIQLKPFLLLLVRPQPEPLLSLNVTLDALTGDPVIEVVGGQPGVYYQFLDAAGNELGRPAYVYQLDEIGNQPGVMNKGVNQLRMGLDFAVGRSQASTGHRGYVAPSPHRVKVGSSALGSTLSVRAKRARTRILADLSRSAAIPILPEIRFEVDTVTAGSVGRIQVIGSLDGDRYEPFLDGVVVKQARWGNGGDLVFLTEAVTETTTFEVHVTRPGDAGLPVTRIVQLTLKVEG